jgi:hypothetical protein
MTQPRHGDALIRDAAAGYLVVDAVTFNPLGGPYARIADAVASARRLVVDGHVWRELADGRGRVLGRPFLLELQPSTIAVS